MNKIKAFLHPTMLRTVRSFRRLMKDFPAGTGYGAALMLIEILSSEDEQKIPIVDVDIVADEIGISIPILNTIISKYNIFIVKDNYIKCPMLDEWLQPFKKKVEQNRKAGKISAQKRKEKAKQQELQLLQDLSVTNSTQQMFNTCLTNKKKENKRKETTTQTESSSNLDFEDWLIVKSKQAKNKQAYKATIRQKYNAGEKSVVDEFEEWKKQKKWQKEEEKLISLRRQKIVLDQNSFVVVGVEKKENIYTVHLQEAYKNSYRINFKSLEEIEKRVKNEHPTRNRA